MNQSFQKVVQFYKPSPPKLTHRQEVMRLYRNSLRNIKSLAESRELFNDEATKLRAQFNQNKSVSVAIGRKLVTDGREKLQSVRHPDPYLTPFMPGGTLYMRNPAIPLDILYPDGIPEGVSRRQLNIDMSNVPDDQLYADKAFVDSVNKTYWIEK